MKLVMVIIGCGAMLAAAFIGYAPATPLAQRGGGKAEPNRIQFKRGTSSASVTGSVRSSEEAEYVVEARSGQTIYLEVDATPKNSAVVSKLVQEGGNEIPVKKEGPGRWSAKLSEDSDYMIMVTKVKPGRTTSRYRLKVRIK